MLQLRNLSCGYPGGFGLHEINLDVAAGDLVGIIGPNGSGKTTLLRAASRVLHPTAGEIRLLGRDLRSFSLRELARTVAVVTQNPSVSGMTLGEFVLLGRLPYHERFQFFEREGDLDAARRAMDATGCWELRDHRFDQVSGGERQLALIAQALAQEPRVLLLDEPTSFLDIAHQVRVLDLVRRLNRDLRLTVMMVLHDLNFASEYCERLVLLHHGRIHTAGAPEDVINYGTIEEVYDTLVVVDRNPISRKPYVLTVSEDQSGGGSGEAPA